jgi:hypothetical protein
VPFRPPRGEDEGHFGFTLADKESRFTYEHLDSDTQRLFTWNEWQQINKEFWANDATKYEVNSAQRVVSLSPFRPKVEVSLWVNYDDKDFNDHERITYFVYEDGGWKHRFGEEEYEVFGVRP